MSVLKFGQLSLWENFFYCPYNINFPHFVTVWFESNWWKISFHISSQLGNSLCSNLTLKWEKIYIMEFYKPSKIQFYKCSLGLSHIFTSLAGVTYWASNGNQRICSGKLTESSALTLFDVPRVSACVCTRTIFKLSLMGFRTHSCKDTATVIH